MRRILFNVLGFIPGIGKRQHVIRAENKDVAWSRFCRAYPKKKCEFLGISPVIGGSVK